MKSIESPFRAALFDPEMPIPDGLQDGTGRPARKRFNVYRNNVTIALIQATRSAFPLLLKLLGAENFDHLARRFIRAHPPKSPVMMHYGDEMPAFLATLSQLQHIPYLPDVARLELAMRRSYHARDALPFDAAQLAAVTPEALMMTALTLTAAVELVPSDWPLFDIWRFNTQTGADQPRAIAQPVLITRSAFDPVPRALSPSDAAWISAVLTGSPLSEAQDAACAVNPDFDPTAMLTLLVQTNSIATLNTLKE